MDRWDSQPQDLIQVRRSKFKKLLAVYAGTGVAIGLAFGAYFMSGGVC